jgi:hypothetical protein
VCRTGSIDIWSIEPVYPLTKPSPTLSFNEGDACRESGQTQIPAGSISNVKGGHG